jgi:hypothetical protein
MSKNLMLRVMIGATDQLSGPLRNIIGLGQSASQQQAALKKEARDTNKEAKSDPSRQLAGRLILEQTRY